MDGNSAMSGLYVNPQSAPDIGTLSDESIGIAAPGLDCRVRLAAVFAAALCAFLMRGEWLLGAAALGCVVWLFALGCPKQGVTFAILYALLLWMQLSIPPQHVLASLALLASIMRRMLLPGFMAISLTKAPTGVLLASLGRMGLPRQFTVSLAVVFRFMPTVAGEYHAIRTSQKFRGIGVSAWDFIAHPARSYETILVPLLIRTTRIADELAASAMLRGAADKGKMSSFRPVRFGVRDAVCLAVVVVAAAALITADFLTR